jgi:rhamnogalacturonyl hydrolase YesR
LGKVNSYLILIFIGSLFLLNCRNTREVTFEELRSPEQLGIDTLLELYIYKYKRFIETHPDSTLSPRSYQNDQLNMVSSEDWTSGFFPGILWYLYEYSGDADFLRAAESWTHALKDQSYNTSTHDIGFIINSSYGQGYRITKSASYKEILNTAAESLASRYLDEIGCIISLDEIENFDYPVLIDNMVNLEVLYKTWKMNSNEEYYDIANKHAINTMERHFRSDFSSFQVVDYDPESFLPKYKGSFQGYSDSTAWARGQSWGLYGFVVAFRETGDRVYLDQSIRIASYILGHENFPEDCIPYWDYLSPDIPNTYRDATSAAILASALIELSSFSEVKQPEQYLNVAERIIHTMVNQGYINNRNECENFVLNQGVGSFPLNTEVGVPLIYGDYYLLEALIKYKNLKINPTR